VVDGEGQGRGEHPCAVGSTRGGTPGDEVETEGEASGEGFFRVVAEVLVAVDLDRGECSSTQKVAGPSGKTITRLLAGQLVCETCADRLPQWPLCKSYPSSEKTY
jgi:hypothetical protein